MSGEFIEIVGVGDGMCFKAHPETLEPLGTSYYEPAAITDPAGRRQMFYSEWLRKRDAMRLAEMRAHYQR